MDGVNAFLTSAVLGGICYDAVKAAGSVTKQFLRERLQKFLISEEQLTAIVEEAMKASETDRKSAKYFEAYVESNTVLQQLMKEIQPKKHYSQSGNQFTNSPNQQGDGNVQNVSYGDTITTHGQNSPGKVTGDYTVDQSTTQVEGDQINITGDAAQVTIDKRSNKNHTANKKKRKILVLAAQPIDQDPLRIAEEIREIEEGLRRANRRDEFELVTRMAVRTTDLRRAILDEEPNIVHFSGHGMRSENKSAVLLEDENGLGKPIGEAALANLLGILSENIECVILNACYSEPQARAISAHIPCVIGMSNKIEQQAAIEFSVAFYDTLGAGKSYKIAYEIGCNALDMRNLDGADTPVFLGQKNDEEL
ncbi:MAG: CHAT domain-containing protein [Calditrichia bacterium]